MPVRNAAPYLDASITSILTQTHQHFEFIIGDDGSTDGSDEIIGRWAAYDRRIRFHRREGPGLGPVGSSNWVAGLAEEELVARMDADDISDPKRFEVQLEAFRAHPEAVLVASLWEGIDPDGQTVHGTDKSLLLERNGSPFLHGTIMYRNSVFRAIGGYREIAIYWEDSDLFWRFANAGAVMTVPLSLYSYRYSDHSSRFGEQRRKFEEAHELGSRWGRARLTAEPDHDTLREWQAEIAGINRVDPRIFVGSYGYGKVWAGKRPGMFIHFLRRAKLGLNLTSIRSTVWLLVAEFAPRTLRRRMAGNRRKRDRQAEPLLPSGSVQWLAPCK